MMQIFPPLPDHLEKFVTGSLVESPEPDDLGQDMVDVALPNGVVIHAGWYPECDPNGRYLIHVAKGLENLISPISSNDVWEVASDIANLAERFEHFPNLDGISDAEFCETEVHFSSYDPNLVAA